mmetsp:Transcript_122820/g.244298  ORF Transcript_122820/g.244298 Transcript_122820/m.244298 type:complete len:202 (+) Transcript_122820:15-620(+)
MAARFVWNLLHDLCAATHSNKQPWRTACHCVPMSLSQTLEANPCPSGPGALMARPAAALLHQAVADPEARTKYRSLRCRCRRLRLLGCRCRRLRLPSHLKRPEDFLEEYCQVANLWSWCPCSPLLLQRYCRQNRRQASATNHQALTCVHNEKSSCPGCATPHVTHPAALLHVEYLRHPVCLPSFAESEYGSLQGRCPQDLG